jgi:WD40 repeat protein
MTVLQEFEQEEDPSSRSFFSEIISSISDVRFSHDGRYILSRDYLTVKIWDVNMERHPVKTIPIHEHLRPRLCDTYENDSIFDKFEVVFSGDGGNVMTGSYNNNFMIYPSDPDKETEVVLQADKSAFKAKKVGVPTPINSTSPTSGKKGSSRAGSPAAGAGGQGGRMRKETDADQIDFNKKILHMSWHPFEDSIAIAATNNVSICLLTSCGVLTYYAALRLLGLVMKTNVLVFQSNILDVLLSSAAITVPSCFSVERHHSQGAEEDAGDRLRQADERRAAEAGVEVKPR